MSQASKTLKYCCFAAILAGLAVAVHGLFGIVGGEPDAYAPTACGAVGMALGLWAARAANVPSNAASIIRAALAAALLCVVVTVIWLVLGGGVGIRTVVAGGLPSVCVLLVALMAARVRREQELR